MTTTSMQPDLGGFLMAHRAFRAEFGRLAAVARAPRDAAHERLIDDQIDLVMHLLHHHHTTEDEVIWPTLLARVPAASTALDRLEAQHEEMDPLFTAIVDRHRPLPGRADHLEALHEVLNAHLDEEERTAVPLIVEHMTADEWEAIGKDVQKSLDRRRLPTVFGWLGSVLTREERAAAQRELPVVVRVLFRLVWGPAYERRFAALYGGQPAVPVPA
jgi:hypothetical protein